MRRFVWLLGLFGSMAAACQDSRPRPASGDPAPSAEPPHAAAAPTAPPGDPYRADIENLCDALNRSGADQLKPGDRQFAIANWLGNNLQTEAAHAFLVHIQPLQGMAKADALVAEAKRVGLPDCALALEWRGPGAVNPP